MASSTLTTEHKIKDGHVTRAGRTSLNCFRACAHLSRGHVCGVGWGAFFPALWLVVMCVGWGGREERGGAGGHSKCEGGGGCIPLHPFGHGQYCRQWGVGNGPMGHWQWAVDIGHWTMAQWALDSGEW